MQSLDNFYNKNLGLTIAAFAVATVAIVGMLAAVIWQLQRQSEQLKKLDNINTSQNTEKEEVVDNSSPSEDSTNKNKNEKNTEDDKNENEKPTTTIEDTEAEVTDKQNQPEA